MATVTLPPKTFVDLYAATGITVGTQLAAINLTPDDVRLFDTQNEPTSTDNYTPCLYRGGAALNSATDLGAWAWSLVGGALEVKEV